MEAILSGVSLPVIATAVYWIVNLLKYTINNEKMNRYIPLISAGLGVVIGVIAFFAVPGVVPTDNLLVAIVIGGASGLSATGFNQIVKQLKM